ncbi:hypothetical protein Syun_001751 [Stephania yunnanensis]|uniref:Uncharacterized protein n=1 Tax=Stephania yunnanensis TaxID=152371 RepID=A0AAP0LEH0_9MAGN
MVLQEIQTAMRERSDGHERESERERQRAREIFGIAALTMREVKRRERSSQKFLMEVEEMEKNFSIYRVRWKVLKSHPNPQIHKIS